MARCPKCKKEVAFLHKFVEFEKKFKFWPDFELYLDEYDTDKDLSFECPECGEELFKEEEDASRFLGKKLVKTSGTLLFRR